MLLFVADTHTHTNTHFGGKIFKIAHTRVGVKTHIRAHTATAVQLFTQRYTQRTLAHIYREREREHYDVYSA